MLIRGAGCPVRMKLFIAFAIVLSGFISLLGSGTASASVVPSGVYYPGATRCTPQHCYLRAVDNRSGITGLTAVMTYSYMSMLDQTQDPYEEPVIDHNSCPTSFSTHICPWSVSKEMWVADSQGKHWVEVGLRNGYEAPDWKLPSGQPGCNCQAYYLYWEDGPGSAIENTHIIANISPDNSVHSFTIQRGTGSHVWDIYIDGRLVGVSTLSGENSFGVSAIGSETNAITTVQPLSLVDSTCITGWSVRTANGTWTGITQPNGGFRGYSNDQGTFDQTYAYTWNGAAHQMCFAKGNAIPPAF